MLLLQRFTSRPPCVARPYVRISKTSGYQTERTKPFPLTEIDFSGNELTVAGIGDVVQFARTQGCEATLIDLSKNNLNDAAAQSELTRLVKNYGSFASQSFISELLLSGNKICKTGAQKLIQYAHWERDRFKEEGKPPPFLKLDLSDNTVEGAQALCDELLSKRIAVLGARPRGRRHRPPPRLHRPAPTHPRPPKRRPGAPPGGARGGGRGGGGGGCARLPPRRPRRATCDDRGGRTAATTATVEGPPRRPRPPPRSRFRDEDRRTTADATPRRPGP